MANRLLNKDYYFQGKDYSSGYHTDIPDELAILIDIDNGIIPTENISTLDNTKVDNDMIGWTG